MAITIQCDICGKVVPLNEAGRIEYGAYSSQDNPKDLPAEKLDTCSNCLRAVTFNIAMIKDIMKKRRGEQKTCEEIT